MKHNQFWYQHKEIKEEIMIETALLHQLNNQIHTTGREMQHNRQTSIKIKDLTNYKTYPITLQQHAACRYL